MTDRVLIVGCGYTGRRLAAALAPRPVSAIVRTGASAAALHASGIRAEALDLDADLRAHRLGGQVLVWLVPPPPTGVVDTRLRGFLDRVEQPPVAIVLLSTTGVYGDCAGAWVDETAPLRPQADRALRRADAEAALGVFAPANGVRAVVLRVAGIYGPGRLPAARLRAREPVIDDAHAPLTNRIHVDDLVETLIAAIQRGPDGAVYNVADGDPQPMNAYFDRVADALGLPRPPRIAPGGADARISAGMRSYLAESRRIDNRRLREELGVRLRYPTLAAGLANST